MLKSETDKEQIIFEIIREIVCVFYNVLKFLMWKHTSQLDSDSVFTLKGYDYILSTRREK